MLGWSMNTYKNIQKACYGWLEHQQHAHDMEKTRCVHKNKPKCVMAWRSLRNTSTRNIHRKRRSSWLDPNTYTRKYTKNARSGWLERTNRQK